MTMILRLLLFLAAVATLLVAMMGSGILSQSQMSGAERQLASQYQIAALVQRGRITRLQTETALTALLNGEASARTLILTQHAQLQRLADQYQTSALDNAAGADRYVQAVSRFNAATLLVLDANNTGGARAARTPLATLMGRAGDLADVEDALLMHGDAAITEAQAALDDTRALAGLERAVAAGLGLALIFVLAWITFLRTGRPLISLARQARHALQAPPQEMPEFIVEPPAPGEARELARALNSLVAQLQEKYLDLERANAELHELNHEARSASQAKTTFVASISHELRTPLNAIIGFSEMLADGMYGPLNDKQRQQIERILRSSQQLLALINDVLDLSRVESGKISMHVAPVDVRQLAAGVINSIEPLARGKGLTLQLQLPATLPPLLTDENRVRQVLLNLVSNAIKFTKQGSVTLAVGTSHNLPNWMLFRVIDTGIGIPAAELDHIWDEFYQVSSGLSRAAGGSGLGLAIVRKLLQLLDGDIEVQSREGGGSEFTVYLPLVPSAARDGAAGASLYAATGSYTAPR